MARKDDKRKTAKTTKKHRPKMIRDSFTMPSFDYDRIKALKMRFLNSGIEMKKSEVLRAGLLALENLNESQLQKLAGEVERIKTGRPSTSDNA